MNLRKVRYLLPLVPLGCLAISFQQVRAEFPMSGGNPQRSGFVDTEGATFRTRNLLAIRTGTTRHLGYPTDSRRTGKSLCNRLPGESFQLEVESHAEGSSRFFDSRRQRALGVLNGLGMPRGETPGVNSRAPCWQKWIW